MKKRNVSKLLGGFLATALITANVLGVGADLAYAESNQYYDGNFTESAHVEFHEVVNYDMYVTVSVKDGVISRVALNDEKNEAIESVHMPYIKYAFERMADSYVGTTGEAVDVVSGATYSSNAINEAVAKAMVKSAANEADEVKPDVPNTDAGQTDSDNTQGGTTVPDNNQTGNYAGVLKTGVYELTADSYDASAMMKLPVFICIDAEKNTFVTHPYTNGVVDYTTDKGSGSITYDEATGVYTMTYEAGVSVVSIGATTTFTATADSITFTSPLKYGAAQMNTVDEAGNFLSYTAKASGYAGELTTGAYELTADSYDASAMMKLPVFICIDTEKNTFVTHPYTNGVVDYATDKGSGVITFDALTGNYVMTYEAGVSVVTIGATTTFTAAADSITFTSPLKYGAAQMNTVDEAGNFLSYTAKASEYAGELTSGEYVLTADSYDASAMMKMPAYIGIDMDNKTFEIHPYTNNVVDYTTDKGSGSIAFDALTGSYVMTYEAGVSVVSIGATTTFMAAADSITFTSPLKYGAAQMNTVDEAGNFLTYTAKRLVAEGTTDSELPQDQEKTESPEVEEGATGNTGSEDSETSNPSNSSDTSVKTGDTASVGIYLVFALISGIIVVAVFAVKRRRNVM